MTADWLQNNLSDSKVRVFEVSVDPGVYERGHIPGAVKLNWHTDLVDKQRRDIALARTSKDCCGMQESVKDTTIILYGDNNNWFAAWGAWNL